MLYTCCRDGKVRHNEQQRKTSATRRMTPSRKLGETFCLARMIVKENVASCEVTVHYIATHTNHQLSIEENKFLPLPLSVKKEVGEKFSKGVSIERIMDGQYTCMFTIYNRIFGLIHIIIAYYMNDNVSSSQLQVIFFNFTIVLCIYLEQCVHL